MRLNETSNEFENIKSSTAADKLRYAERRIDSLEHRQVVNNIGFYPFEDRFIRFQHVPMSDEERKKGFIPFHSIDLRKRPSFAIYHSLSPREIAILAEVFKKKIIISGMITKLEKSLTTLKRKVKIEAGTYISKEQLATYKTQLQHELANVIRAKSAGEPGRYRVLVGKSKTKLNGRSRLDINVVKDGSEGKELSEREGVDFKDYVKRIKGQLELWLDSNRFTDHRVAFNQRYFYGPINPTLTASGAFEIRVQTANIIEKYKK